MTQAQPPFAWPRGKRAAVSLSFDDARLSEIDYGMAIFEKHDVRATFYLTPRNVEQRIDGWKRAVAFGHEMGNHTVKHPCSGNFGWGRDVALEERTLEWIENDILEANRYIQTTLGVKPTTFAYPCGQTFVGRGKDLKSYVPVVAKHFLAGRTYNDEFHNDPGYCDLARLMCFGFDSLKFDQVLALITRTVERGGWLVLAGHEISPDWRYQVVHTDMLNEVLSYCAKEENGVWIDTVANVAGYVVKQRGER